MNRRMFFGSSAALVATGGLGSSRKIHAQASATPLAPAYVAAGAAMSIVSAHYANGTLVPSDLFTLSNTMKAAQAMWIADNRDPLVSATISNLNHAKVRVANLDQRAMVSNIQLYDPAFTSSQLTSMLMPIDASIPINLDDVTRQIRSAGMSRYFGLAAAEARNIGAALALGGPPPSPGGNSISRPDPLNPSKFNCQNDALFAFGLATAFTVISIMTAGGADAILVGAAWAGFSFWGGTAAGAYGVVHYAICGL